MGLGLGSRAKRSRRSEISSCFTQVADPKVQTQSFRVLGFRVLGFRVLGFRV